MPKVRKGPGGPRKSAAGKKGTNRRTPHSGASTSGKKHEKYISEKGTGGKY